MKAACLVALSEGDANEWRKLGVPVQVIPNIVHLNDGNFSSLNQKHVIFVGRLDYQKRPMLLVQIWKELFLRHPDWHLDIYGEGKQKQTLQNVIDSQNLNIHLHEPTSQIFEAYRNSSILVVTSLYEPFGLVIPEAMSCGLPVVSFDSPYGPSFIITDGKDGYLVEKDNNAVFTKRLEQLMDDTSLRLQMGACAVESSKRFTAQQIMPKWKGLFNSFGPMSNENGDSVNSPC
jgi:glycosyltransferase involved in cell wall biosynthesis